MPNNENKFKKFMGKVKNGLHKIRITCFTKKQKEHSERFYNIVDFLNKYSALFHLLMALIIVFIVEFISRRNAASAINFVRIHPLAYLYNSFIVFASLMIVYLFRRRGFMRVLISAIWIILGITNGCILSKRVTPFTYNDLSTISDLFTMTNTNYVTIPMIVMIIVGAVLLISFLVMLFIKGPRFEGKKHPIIVPAIVAAVLFIGIPAVTSAATSTNIVETYYHNIAQGYMDNGFIYSFSSTVIDRGMSEPDDYSKDTMLDIVFDMTNHNEVTETKSPNVICILLESFCDPEQLNILELNEDPIPYYHYLEKNFTSGYCNVPVVGAGTANTEFEVLTGMSVKYFGTGELPYKTVLKERNCESAASDLKKLGYASHVVHNNGGNFYSRANAFAMMGFDTFSSKECLYITDYTPNGSWAEDDILVDETIKSFDATEGPDFSYIITVGTHGDYPTTQIIDDPEYTVSGLNDDGKTNAWTYYFNQLHKTDLFIERLITELEKRDEDTIVVMFGDHLPTMGLTDDDMKSGDIYKTEYITWNNMGLEKKDCELYSYQLLASTFDSIGIHNGTVFGYHQQKMKAEAEETEYMRGLELIQYDLLYGKRYMYGGFDLYPATDLVMGLDEIEIKHLTAIEQTGMLVISGDNFTPWSKVFVNGDKVSTTVINRNTLSISLDKVSDGDSIVVNCMGSSNTIFRSSNEVIYNETQATETEETEGTEPTE